MKKLSLKTWINKFNLVLIRFSFTLLFIIGLSVLCFLSIQKVNIEIHERLWAFFILGALLNVAITLFLEEFKKPFIRILFNLLSVILLAVYCFTLPLKLEEYKIFQLIAFGIVFVLSAFVGSFLKKNNEITFWNFSRISIIQLIVSGFFSLVLYGGLGLAILSLDKLFNIHIDVKVYSNLAVVCYVLFAPLYFLSNVPTEIEKRKQEFELNKILKILGLCILLPILAAYAIILYIYLLRIISIWQLPNGWVSMLVSALGLGGFLSMFILFPLRLKKENKVVNLLFTYFPVILLPLLVLMSVGIFRRLGDYGMTINRLYVLILNGWLYGISIYLFLTKANHLKWIVISFAAVLFFSSIGPWSVYNITKHTMVKEIGQLLNETKLLKDGKVIDNIQKKIVVNQKLAESLSEDIKYVCNIYGIEKIQFYFKNSFKTKTWSEIITYLGINDLPVNDTFFNAWLDKKESTALDVGAYHTFVNLPSFNSKTDKILSNSQMDISFKNLNIQLKLKNRNGSSFIIPMKPKLKELIRSTKKNSSHPTNEMIITAENYKLIIISVSGNYYSLKDSININNFDAQLFIK